MVKFFLLASLCLDNTCLQLNHYFDTAKQCQAESIYLLESLIENEGTQFTISCTPKKFL